MNEQPYISLGPWSLRKTLLGILLTLTISVWGASAVIVYLDADQESQELFDQSLAETGRLLLTLAEHEVEESTVFAPAGLGATTLSGDDKKTAPEPESDSEKGEPSQYLLFQIWDSESHLIYKNTGAPDVPFANKNASGLGWVTINGLQWRTYATWDKEHRLQIQVGEPSSHRKDISGRFAYKLLLFAMLVLPLMVGGIWWAVNRVFKTLQKSADEVSRRTPNNLQKVSLDGAPIEVHPLLHAINRLFERVSRTLEHEQRFTADAAHELRTPLAAIKTNLQVIQRARNDAERTEAIGGLGTSVDRATRLVEQLMTLARLDPQYDQSQSLVVLDLATLLTTQLPSLRVQAEKLQLHFDVDLQAATCLLHPDSCLILFRNVIDNAFRYTPPNGHVQLSCRTQGKDVCLTIADSGVGIPAEMRERVFDRFVRLSDANKPGSGLGLSIVKRIVETHFAKITLMDGLANDLVNDLNRTGLTVEIRFVAVAAGAAIEE
ncbi:N/A [soil metagenome]